MIRLVVFDCDGTLVDSQHVIVAAMQAAFEASGRAMPEAAAVREVVGLSLPVALGQLLPEGAAEAGEVRVLAKNYTEAFHALRRAADFDEPLFDGARAVLDELDRRGLVLGIATGKSRRGLLSVLEHHDLTGRFASLQTADRHPSKPHPGMLEAAMQETGSDAEETLLIGDTSYDMAMATAAGVGAVGVAWGYHPVAELERAGAMRVLERFEQLLDVVAAA